MTRTCGTLFLALIWIGCETPAAVSDDAGIVDASTPLDADPAIDGGPSDTGVATDGAVSVPDAALVDAGPGELAHALETLASPTASAAELDELLHDVAWGGGWPLDDGERFLFATRWDGAPGSVSLVGDINAWAPAAAPATRAASGVHYYVVIAASAFTSPASGSKYKWYGSGEVYRAPPEATAYGFDAFGEHGWVRPPTDAPWLERFPAFASAFLDERRAFRAYLPAGFDPRGAAASSARTLLLHDGQNVFHPDAFFGGWRVDEALASAAYRDVVALAIDNAPDRMSAYTHVSDTATGSRTGGRADDYLRLVVEEALPFFRARYGVRATGASLMIAGSSLGGLVSVYGAMEEPELAGCIAALSPTLGWGAYASGARSALAHLWPDPGHLAVAIYLDSGGGGTCSDPDGDGVQEDADDSDNYCVTRQLRDLLVGRGYTLGTDLHYAHAPGAPHNEASWRARFPGALDACASAGWL